jgi:quinol monooxygenase YgiN
MTVLALIKLTAKKGQEDALDVAMQEPIAATRANPECSRMQLFANTEEPTNFLLVEEWTTIAAHERHVDDLMGKNVLGPMGEVSEGMPETLHYLETDTD